MQYRINLAKRNWGMRKLNEILPRLQDEFESALNKGDVLELEDSSLSWLDDALLLDAPSS